MIFRKSISIHYFRNQVSLVQRPPHIFAQPPCCYIATAWYEQHGNGIPSNGTALNQVSWNVVILLSSNSHTHKEWWTHESFLSLSLSLSLCLLWRKVDYTFDVFHKRVPSALYRAAGLMPNGPDTIQQMVSVPPLIGSPSIILTALSNSEFELFNKHSNK